MPYIEEWEKKHLKNESKRRVLDTFGSIVASPKELGYAITTVILSYVGDTINYKKINEIIGILECIKLELYRRIAVPYQESDIEENGDIF